MRQMTGTMLLLSSAVVMAAPWAHAAEKTIQLTEAEQQEIKTANEKLLSLTLRFLHDSWPLEIMYPGEVQEEFHSILQCHQMLEQFRQTLPLHFIYLDEYEQDPSLILLKKCIIEVWGLADDWH